MKKKIKFKIGNTWKFQPVYPIPYKCPICGGTGKVSTGFYEPYSPKDTIVINPQGEICRACGGTGIVWSKAINIEESENNN